MSQATTSNEANTLLTREACNAHFHDLYDELLRLHPEKDDEVLLDCDDCGVNTAEIGEYYMVHAPVWDLATAWHEHNHVLCIGCLESRLGRKLNREDFSGVPVNLETADHYSPRLWDRLTAPPKRPTATSKRPVLASGWLELETILTEVRSMWIWFSTAPVVPLAS